MQASPLKQLPFDHRGLNLLFASDVPTWGTATRWSAMRRSLFVTCLLSRRRHTLTRLPLPHEVLGSVAVGLTRLLSVHLIRMITAHVVMPQGFKLFSSMGAKESKWCPDSPHFCNASGRDAHVANSVAQGGDLPWSVVEPVIIDAGCDWFEWYYRPCMCSDGYGAKDSEILTGIVQHPAVQQAVVAPALADELGHPDTGRSSQALRTHSVGETFKGTTAELQAMSTFHLSNQSWFALHFLFVNWRTTLIQALDSTSRSEVVLLQLWHTSMLMAPDYRRDDHQANQRILCQG